MDFVSDVPIVKIDEGEYMIRFSDWLKQYFNTTLDSISEEEYKELWNQFEIWASFLGGYHDIKIHLEK